MTFFCKNIGTNFQKSRHGTNEKKKNTDKIGAVPAKTGRVVTVVSVKVGHANPYPLLLCFNTCPIFYFFFYFSIQALNYKHQLKSESPLMDENRSPDQEMYQQHPADQQRLSIANGQSANNGGRHSSGGGNVAGTRGGKLPKTAMFSSNPASNSGRAGRLLLPSMMTASSYGGHAADDTVTHERGGGGGGSVGVAKAFPMRPSHFRERNRSLFKQVSYLHL